MPGRRNKRRVGRRVVGISGSPRRGGSSDTLLDSALAGASSVGADVVKIIIGDMDIGPCRSCGGCLKTGSCAVADDMRRVYRMVGDADAVIVASGVFFGGVTAQLKAMIDRFHCVWVATRLLGKAPPGRPGLGGYILCTCGSPGRRHFTHATGVVRNFFATVGAKYSGGVFAAGLDGRAGRGIGRTAAEKAFRLGRSCGKTGRAYGS